jgi:hypothetical protein
MISTLLAFFSILNVGTEISVGFEKEKWISVQENSLLIKDLTIPRNRHRRGVVELQNFSKATSDGAMSMELLTEYDCKKGTFRLINHRGFSEINLEGELVYDWRGFDPRAFVGIPTGTPARNVFEIVCGYKRKAAD